MDSRAQRNLMGSWGNPHNPSLHGLFMAMMKIDRLVNLMLKGVTPKKESLRDTWDDLKNYVDLAEACFLEESKDDG